MKCHLEEEDEPEPGVVEQSAEDIHVIFIDQTAVYLVEEAHEHESVEDEGVEDHLVRWVVFLDAMVWISFLESHFLSHQVECLVEEHSVSGIHQDQDGEKLVEGLSENVSPHDSVHDFVSSADTSGASLTDVLGLKRLGANGDGGQSVHDQVDPEQLNDIERRVSEGETTQENDKAQCDVDRQLELHEFAYISEDRSAPHDCVMDRLEIVIHNHQV